MLPGAPKSDYRMSNFNFAFVSSPEAGRQQATKCTICREYVNRAVMSSVTKVSVEHHKPGKYPEIDMEKLRLLIIHDPEDLKAFKTRLFNGKAILNLLEGINGWKPSTITTVKHENYNNVWLITGPKEWMSQPQTLSIATWMLRLAAYNGPIDVDNYKNFESNLKNLLNENCNSSDVSNYLIKGWNRIYPFIKYHDEIFEGMDLETAWKHTNTHTFMVRSGFFTFTDGKPTYSEAAVAAQERFKAVCEKYFEKEK